MHSILSKESYSDRTISYITTVVVSLHVAVVAILAVVSSSTVPIVLTPPKFVVRTVTLEPKKAVVEKKETVKESPPEVPKEKIIEPKSEPIVEKPAVQEVKKKAEVTKKVETVKPKQKPKSKPITAKVETKPKPKAQPKKIAKKSTTAKTPSSQPVVKRNENEGVKKKKLELLAAAQKNIAKVDSTPKRAAISTDSIATTIPSQIGALHVETFISEQGEQLNTQERTYYDELASKLKMSLRLPEYGAVKIKLTLERSGKVTKVAIVSAESSTNRKYIEKNVSSLKFPNFGENFKNYSDYTFVISLNND